MQKLRFLLNIIDTINDKAGKIVSFLIFPMFGVVVYEVVMRYGLNAPTAWAHETTKFIFGTFVILAGGYCLFRRSHVNVDLAYSRFPPRTKAIVDVFTFGLFFFFCIVLLWKGGVLGWKSLLAQETSGSPWNPVLYPAKLMIPLGAFLILIQGVAKFTRDLITAITGVSWDEH